MKKNIKNILLYNIKTLIGFELIYKIISVVIFGPIFLSLFKLITHISGYNYLTLENIIPFLLNTITLIFLFILIMFITFYTIIDISTIIIILDNAYQKKKITIKNAFIVACKKSLRIFKKKNLLFPILVIFLIPFLNIGISSGFVSTISVPEFILDYINKNSILSILYFVLIISLTIILFRWLYVIHYFVLEECNFKESKKKSINLSKKNKLKDFISIIITQIIIVLLYIVFILLGIFIISLLYKYLGKNLISSFSITMIWFLIALSYIVLVLMATPISYAIISVRFYKHKEEIKENVVHVKTYYKDNKKINKKFNILKYCIIILCIFSGTLFTYSVINGYYDLKIEYIRQIEVTAHRGASINYPENTMSAFIGAKELGADWIELDVQQTKDKEIIVLHDTNLKRTTGLDKNTWEVTYDEIKDLDAGSHLNSKFSDERIPTLKEVIKYALDNNIKLNIELKPTGREIDFEKMVVDIINEYNFSSNCVVTSQVYNVLENVKKYDNNIKTVYVMSLAYGNITDLIAADSFSVEASSITKTLVKKVHNSGKELYAWTVNTKESIDNMIDLNVDNIITDNIDLAKEEIYSSKTSDVINEYIKFVNNLLK